MADYPEWVTRYKEKGIYIKRSKDKYYLYRGHSQRIPGTKKVRFICDEYMGRITEKDGLIPPQDKVKGDVISYEYGLSSMILASCDKIYKGLRKSFVKNGDFIMVASTLTYIYGHYSEELFYSSWLSMHFPELIFPDTITEAQKLGIERGERMIADIMRSMFNDELPMILSYLSLIHLIRINGRIYPSKIPTQAVLLLDKYKIKLEEYHG